MATGIKMYHSGQRKLLPPYTGVKNCMQYIHTDLMAIIQPYTLLNTAYHIKQNHSLYTFPTKLMSCKA